ncbi:MAG: hypothetical protein A2V63_11140 [Candidatus Eisenbacteria bacterium RBG_19FT_COMBO_70_11]|nr:MAG: hypothetical protein A2V63_11140 [Candidatus Eisenbacteria bacterium RBG_19FT_COMBO_70_11]
MPPRPPRIPAALVALLLLSASIADAGQVRITVGPGGAPFAFTPSTVSINPGDHAVWVWASGTHTVTDGILCRTNSGKFDSSQMDAPAAFSWWAGTIANNNVPYYCRLHCALGMTGTVQVGTGAPPLVPVSDFRITEVRYSTLHDADFVEIANLGAAAGNLGMYRLSLATGSALTLPLADINVPAGGYVIVHLGQSGTNSDTDIYLDTITLAIPGSAALYVPNTAPAGAYPQAGFGADQMIDFVQWGAGDQANQTAAVNGSFWTPGQFVPPIADGHSMEYCGTVAQHGASLWQEIALPTPGTNGGCTTPALSSSWGRLKTLYR